MFTLIPVPEQLVSELVITPAQEVVVPVTSRSLLIVVVPVGEVRVGLITEGADIGAVKTTAPEPEQGLTVLRKAVPEQT